MKASIIYNSKRGTTKAYAEEIGKFLEENGVENQVESIDNYKIDNLQSADIIMLGCWTSGLFLFAQHPDKVWKHFAKSLPEVKNKKVCLFTTYKLATGSMFRNMETYLAEKTDKTFLYLRSKSSVLTEDNSNDLKQFLDMK